MRTGVTAQPCAAAAPRRDPSGQLRRRRTLGIFVVLVALPLILLAAFALAGDDGRPGPAVFVDLAQESGANLTVFALFASTGFLLIVIVALFAGDTVPSEATLVEPALPAGRPRAPRTRLLRQKLVVAAIFSVVALIFLPAWTLLVGGIAYGWGPYVGPDRGADRLAGVRRAAGDHRGLPAAQPAGGRRLRLRARRLDRRAARPRSAARC